MSNKLTGHLTELVEASVIDKETATKISDYFEKKGGDRSSRINLVYGILGAVLIGAGFILVIAHNWDDLSHSLKTFFSLLPLFLSALLCGFSILKKKGITVWNEVSAILYFFAVGSAMSLIGQIYHHAGSYDEFVKNWLLFVLPVVFILPSYITAILCVCLVTTYKFWMLYLIGGRNFEIPWWYWIIMLAILVFTILMRKQRGFTNAYVLLLWFITLSIILKLGSFAERDGGIMFVAYSSLFSLMAIIGRKKEFEDRNFWQNPLLILGTLGMLVVFYIASYKEVWSGWIFHEINQTLLFSSLEFILSIGILIIAFVVLIIEKRPKIFHPVVYSCYLILFLFLISLNIPGVAAFACNIWLLITGLYFVIRGNQKNSLAWLNFGMLIIGLLIVLRFFDNEYSYLLRGLAMLLFGVGFFTANYRLVRGKKLKTTQQH